MEGNPVRLYELSGEGTDSTTILSSVAAEAIYYVWKKKPYQAKCKKNELFGTFYDNDYWTFITCRFESYIRQTA